MPTAECKQPRTTSWQREGWAHLIFLHLRLDSGDSVTLRYLPLHKHQSSSSEQYELITERAGTRTHTHSHTYLQEYVTLANARSLRAPRRRFRGISTPSANPTPTRRPWRLRPVGADASPARSPAHQPGEQAVLTTHAAPGPKPAGVPAGGRRRLVPGAGSLR